MIRLLICFLWREFLLEFSKDSTRTSLVFMTNWRAQTSPEFSAAPFYRAWNWIAEASFQLFSAIVEWPKKYGKRNTDATYSWWWHFCLLNLLHAAIEIEYVKWQFVCLLCSIHFFSGDQDTAGPTVTSRDWVYLWECLKSYAPIMEAPCTKSSLAAACFAMGALLSENE